MVANQEFTTAGRVVGLWRYPVKSMAGEPLVKADVSWHGIAGDRRWAFVRNDAPKPGFPWLTLRECGEMSQYRPSFSAPDEPDRSPTLVQTPSGAELDVADPALAMELHPQATAIKHNGGIFDTFPISLISTQTIAGLGELVGAELDIRRFRPNIVVEAAGEIPFVEDDWVGRELQLGGLRMRIDKRDGRCVVINIDPRTTRRNFAVLRAVTRNREGCLGVYGSTVQPGRVTVGDAMLIGPPG